MPTIIGSVPYLNARPLVRWFGTEAGRRSGVSVIEDTPARLAAMLESGDIALALVSSFAYLQHPDYDVVPNVSISGQDEIKSVRAFSRLPFRMVHSVAMDISSLTSVALLRILLHELYDCHPHCTNAAPELDAMLVQADAALLIGDKGMLANDQGLRVLDLGEAWRNMTNLPFTYALWLGKPGAANSELSSIIQEARDWGLTQADAIATEQSIRLGCPYAICYEYITEVMDYNLDDEHYQALDTFRAKSRALGLLAEVPQ